MLLLKMLGASEEEQIAGLLHDVSHTAFSHTIDWVIGDGKTEDYQDEQHAHYVAGSDIPVILKKYGYSPNRIVDYHNFGLLERSIPDLCADRIDYSLREFPAEVVDSCVPELRTQDSKIVFASKKAALIFARYFLKKQIEHWGGVEAVSRYWIFAGVLKQALANGTISIGDFWQDDNFVIAKLVASNNQKIQSSLAILRNKSLSYLPKSRTIAHKKFRYVDPLYIEKNEIARLSKASYEFSLELEKARHANELGIAIPSIPNS
jgi:hypothetical protein